MLNFSYIIQDSCCIYLICCHSDFNCDFRNVVCNNWLDCDVTDFVSSARHFMSHSKEKKSNNKTTKTKQWYAKEHGYPCTSEHGNNNGHRFTNKHGWTNEHGYDNRQWIWQDVNYQYVDAQEDLSKIHRFTANIEKWSAIALLAISMILAYIWHYTHSSL